MPPSVPELDELKQLLEETRRLAADNNRLLREMRRNAVLGFIARIVIWLLILGVPLFFLSSYIGPLLDAFAGVQGSPEGMNAGIFSLPSQEQLNRLIEQYRAGGE